MIPRRTQMKSTSARPAQCAVCAQTANNPVGWFLLAENALSDRLRILSWHPTMAALPEIHSVCGKWHLRLLLLHWLAKADLNYPVNRSEDLLSIDMSFQPFPISYARFLGELTVWREPLSRFWNGSPEDLETILSALDASYMNTTTSQSRDRVAELLKEIDVSIPEELSSHLFASPLQE